MSPIGIYVTDQKGKCTFVNKKWCELTGMSSEEALGDGWTEALYPEDRTDIDVKWDEMIESDKNTGYEYRIQSKTGEVHWVYGQASSLTDSYGEKIGVHWNYHRHHRSQASSESHSEK